MKLAAKLNLIFLVGVLAIVSLFSWQTVRRQRLWEEQRCEVHAHHLVEAMRPAIESAYRKGSDVTIQQAIEVNARRLQDTEMRWVDGREVPVEETQMAVTSRELSRVSIAGEDAVRISYSYVPLSIDGDESGAVEVAQAMSEPDSHVRHSIFSSLISLAGVAVLSAIAILVGGIGLVGKPLKKLIHQVNGIGEGNLAQPPVLTSRDELGKLAQAISQMSHRLSDQRDTIRHTDRLGTVGTLAAGMAHELGTPLNVVSGRAGLIASGKLSPQEIESSAQTIRTEAERMTAIIRQLLDFARQVPAAHQTLDLNAVAGRTCELMHSLAKKSDVELRLPSDPAAMRINGDAAQVQQVLANLINNAIQAMPGGGILTVKTGRRGERVYLEVSDTGTGIAGDDIEHVFEPFYTTKDVGEGTGLGLSIAYGIVCEHEGEIKVTSEEGKGTTFTVLFPAVESTGNQQQEQSDERS